MTSGGMERGGKLALRHVVLDSVNSQTIINKVCV